MTLETVDSTTDPASDCNAIVDGMVQRARSLYSLPAVAAKVIELTSNPQVNARVLKECIETDPALTAKILRVVNSSLFGLSREVSDLNQALALLGTKPLKLLVLGFSLPENLFREVAGDQLDWYWATSLTRAVAAREISEQLFDRPGDDAFLAGLFQSIGVLVLLGELKEPYARFLSGVIDQRVDLQRLEVDSLGFDHLHLTAALLEHWQLPESLVEAISAPRDSDVLANSDSPHAQLTQIVHLAELVAELVGHNRLSVLPDLMEVGDKYCGLDKAKLNDLVGTLYPKVKQLAEVLSLELTEAKDYAEIMSAAHQQMSEITEDVVELMGHPSLEEEQAYSNLLADANHLRAAVASFLDSGTQPAVGSNANSSTTVATSGVVVSSPSRVPTEFNSTQANTTHSQSGPTAIAPATSGSHSSVNVSDDFLTQLTYLIGQCRSRRQPVSLMLLEISGEQSNHEQGRVLLGQVLEVGSRSVNVADMICQVESRCRRVLILPNCERHDAVRLAEETVQRIEKVSLHLQSQDKLLKTHANAGIASVTLPPKNFPPLDLLVTAERCLSTAQSTGANVVKSLEIF